MRTRHGGVARTQHRGFARTRNRGFARTRNRGFAVRLVLFATALVCLAVGLSSGLAYRYSLGDLEAGLRGELLAITRSAAALLDADLVDLIYADEVGVLAFEEEFELVRSQLDEVRSRNGLPRTGNPIYVMRPLLDFSDSGLLEFVVMPDPGPDGSFFVGNVYPARDFHREALAGRASSTGVYEDREGVWISAAAPLRGSDGRILGLVQVDRTVDFFYAEARARTLRVAGGALLGVAVALFASLVFARSVVGPLRELAAAVRDLASGRLDRRVAIDRHDELGHLAAGFNEMAEGLETRSREVERAREAAEQSARTQSELLANLETLNGLLETLTDAPDEHEAAVRGVGRCVEAFGWSWGGIVSAEAPAVVVGRAGVDADALGALPHRLGERREVVVTNENDASASPTLTALLGSVDARAVAAVPIPRQSAADGWLLLFSPEPVRLSVARIEAHRNAGRLVGSTLDRLADQRRRAEVARETVAANHALQRAGEAEHGDDALAAALDELRRGLGFPHACRWRVDPVTRRLEPAGSSGHPDPTLCMPLAGGRGLPGHALARRDVVEGIPDDDPRRADLERTGVVDGVALPLLVEGEPVGVLELLATGRLPASEGRAEALRTVSRGLGTLVERRAAATRRAEAARRAAATMAAVARGDLGATMEGEHPEEFRLLQEAINDSVGTLEGLVRRIRDAAIEVSGASHEIEAGSTDLHARTEQHLPKFFVVHGCIGNHQGPLHFCQPRGPGCPDRHCFLANEPVSWPSFQVYSLLLPV